MADLVETAIVRMGVDNADYVRGMGQAALAGDKVVASAAGVVTASDRVTRATRTTADGFARLEARYDPLIRAEQARQRAIATATRYLDEGSISLDRYRAHIARVNQAYDDQTATVQRGNSALAAAIHTVGRLGVAMGVAFGARELVGWADAMTRANSQLQVVTGSAEAAAAVQQQLYDVSQRTRTGFEGNVTLYSRLAVATRELGVSNTDLLRFTEGVGQALAVSGVSAAQATGSLLQLSQAMGGGTVRAEEFNSILEGSPRIAKAVADGMEGIGGSVAKLRQRVIDGEVSSQAFFAAFMSQLPTLQAEFARTGTTIGQAMTKLDNALAMAVGLANESTGAMSGLAWAIEQVAAGVERVGAFSQRFVDTLDSVTLWRQSWEAMAVAVRAVADGIDRLQNAGRGPGVTIPLPAAPYQVPDSGPRGPSEADQKRQVALDKYIAGLETAARVASLETAEKKTQLALDAARNKLLDDKTGKARDLTAEEEKRIRLAVAAEVAADNAEKARETALRESEQRTQQEARQAEQRAAADARRNVAVEQYIGGLESAAQFEALSSTEKEIQRALLDAQNKLLDEQGQRIRDLTDAERSRIANAVREKEALEERARAEKKALEDHAREVKRAEEERVREANRATDRIEDYAADALYGRMKGQNADLWEDFKDLALRTIAQVAAAMIFRPLIQPVVGAALGVGGTGTSGGGAAGGLSIGNTISALGSVDTLSTLGGFGSLGGLAGGISAAASLGNVIFNGAEWGLQGGSTMFANAFGDIGALFGAEKAFMDAGMSFTSPIGSIGSFAANMVLNQLLGDGGMGSQIGSMIGGIAGSFLGPWGAVGGSALGNLVGRLFGGGKASTDIPGGQAELIRSGNMFIGGRPFSGHGGATAGVMSVSEMAASLLNTIQDELGLNLAGGSRWNIEAGNEFASIFTGGGEGSRARFFGLNSTMVHAEGDALVKAVVDGVLRHGARLDMFPGLPTALKEGLADAKNFDETIAALDAFLARRDQLTAMFDDAATAVFDLGSEIEKAAEAFGSETLAQVRSLREEAVKYGLTAAEVAEGLKVAVQRLVEVEAAGEPTMTQFEAQLELVRARFEALKPVLEEVGLAAALADQGLQQAEAAIRDQFDQSISDAILGLTDPLTLALEQLERQQQERLTNAEAIGANMVEVERLNALERQRLIEQQADAAVGAFRTVLDRLRFGDLGGASPVAQLQGTRASFEAAVAQASAGDLMARGRLPELAEQMIELSRGFYASGAGFQSDVQRAIAVLEQFQDLPGFASGTASAPAGWAWVGERGPELVRFRGGEQVLPNGAAPANDGTTREMLRELIALRQEVSGLRAEQARRADEDRDLRGQMRRLASKVA